MGSVVGVFTVNQNPKCREGRCLPANTGFVLVVVLNIPQKDWDEVYM